MFVVGAAIIEDGRCLVAQRSAEMPLPLKWEFPGGKPRDGESPQEALKREVLEELGVSIEVGARLGSGTSSSPDQEIVLTVFRARLLDGNPHPNEHAAIRWVPLADLHELDWAEADVPIVELLARQS